jgi:hypothetical protein
MRDPACAVRSPPFCARRRPGRSSPRTNLAADAGHGRAGRAPVGAGARAAHRASQRGECRLRGGGQSATSAVRPGSSGGTPSCGRRWDRQDEPGLRPRDRGPHSGRGCGRRAGGCVAVPASRSCRDLIGPAATDPHQFLERFACDRTSLGLLEESGAEHYRRRRPGRPASQRLLEPIARVESRPGGGGRPHGYERRGVRAARDRQFVPDQSMFGEWRGWGSNPLRALPEPDRSTRMKRAFRAGVRPVRGLRAEGRVSARRRFSAAVGTSDLSGPPAPARSRADTGAFCLSDNAWVTASKNVPPPPRKPLALRRP